MGHDFCRYLVVPFGDRIVLGQVEIEKPIEQSFSYGAR